MTRGRGTSLGILNWLRRLSGFGHFIEAAMLNRSIVFGHTRKTIRFFMMAVRGLMSDRTMHTI